MFKHNELPAGVVRKTREFIERKLQQELPGSLFYRSEADVAYVEGILDPFFFHHNLLESFFQRVSLASICCSTRKADHTRFLTGECIGGLFHVQDAKGSR